MTRRSISFDASSETGNRRLGVFPGRRFAVVVTVCVGVLCVTAAAVADSSGPLVQATVYGSAGGTSSASVSLATLQGGNCPTYTGDSMQELGRQGSVPVDLPPNNTWSLGTVLKCLTPAVNGAVTNVVVTNSDGAAEDGPGSQLTAADLNAPSDFANPLQTPVIENKGSVVQYDRPQRNPGDEDYLDETQGSPIQIQVFEGPALTVTPSASTTTITAGGTVTFSATVTDAHGNPVPGGGYAWNFDGGGSPSAQPQPQVQFSTPGVWTVGVQVIANGGQGGGQLTITVNPPGGATTPATTGNHTTGPDNSKGTTVGGKAGSTHNNGTTQSHGHHGTSSDTNSPSTKTSTSDHSQQPADQSSPTRGTGAAGTAPSGAGSTGANSSSASGNAAANPRPAAAPTTAPVPSHRATPARAPTHHTRPTPPPPPPGTLVTGRLVSDVVTLPADQSPLVHTTAAPQATAPVRQAPKGASALPAVGAALAVLCLLGLGAACELRGYRRRRVVHIGA